MLDVCPVAATSEVRSGRCSTNLLKSGWKRGRAQVLRHPQQALAQFHRAARRIEAVAIIVAAGDRRKHGLQMWIVQRRHFPLHDSQVRSAQHADLAVRPGLAGDPIQRVVAIGRFLFERPEDALRSDSVRAHPAPLRRSHAPQTARSSSRCGRFAIRSAHQNGRIAARRLRPEIR